MCLALDYANELNQKIEEIKIKYKELLVGEKSCNAEQQDLLHQIENSEKLDLYGGWKMYKSMHELRNKRRKIKNEKQTLELLIKQISDIHIDIEDIITKDNIVNYVSENKVYNPRAELFDTNKLREYYSTQKLPKTKGSSIRVKYDSDGQKNHIMNVLSKNYIEAKLNDKDKYVDLIERK